MAFDVAPEALMAAIGHDGLEVWWPEASGERRLRGFHHQEFVDYGLYHGYAVLMVEAMPNLGCGGRHRIIMEDELQGRINTYLQTFDGVLTSDKHAVAWNSAEQRCYDPNGYIYGIDNFAIREFFIIIRGKDETTERLRRTLQRVGTTETNAGVGTGSAGGPTPAG